MSRLWIVAYDIADERRRRRVVACLTERCERVQESLFEGWLASAEARGLADRLHDLIDLAQDRVRLYPVADATRRQTLGEMNAAAPAPDYWAI